MSRIIVTLLLCFSFFNSYPQFLLKAGVGPASSKPIGIITEVDGGYGKDDHQITIGYQFNPQISKTIFSIQYGYWYNNFTFHGGVGLVNRIINRSNDYYVRAYGTPIIGADYNFKEFAQRSRLYVGADVVDKTLNLKFGIKVFYD